MFSAQDILDKRYETLQLSIEDEVCVVRLNRPDRLNAMNSTMRTELGDCFISIGATPDIRVVVLTGSGDAFCSGGDIADFTGSPQELFAKLRSVSHHWVRALWNLPQPVIAAVNGAAAGGGCSLAVACDLVYAASDARFTQPFLDLGLIPDLGAAFNLPRRIGLSKAKELALLSESLSAAEAEEVGLVNGVHPPEELLPGVLDKARKIAKKPAAAVALAKRVLNRSYETSHEALLDYELTAQGVLLATPEFLDKVNQFLSRSKKHTPDG